MKKTMKTAAALVVLATPAFAAGNLENPLYAPKAGEVYSKTGIGAMYKVADDTAAQVLKGHNGATEFPIGRITEELGYGITDRLSVNGQFGYTYNGDIDRKGLHLGRLGLTYRAMADADNLVWDIYADAHLGGVSKMTGTFTLPEKTFDYDNYTTGQYGVYVGTKVGKTWDKLTGAAYAEVGYFLPNDNTRISPASSLPAGYITFTPGTHAVAKMDTFIDWNIGTKWTYDFAPKWTGGLGLAWKHHAEHKVKSAKVNGTIGGGAGVTNAVLEAGFDNKGLEDSFDEFPITLSVANQITDNVQVALYGEYTFDNGDDGSQNSTDTKVELGARVNVRF